MATGGPARRCAIETPAETGIAPFAFRALARAGDADRFEWWVDGRPTGDGGPSLAARFARPGQHYVHLRATWPDGAVAAADQIVTVRAPGPGRGRARGWFGRG